MKQIGSLMNETLSSLRDTAFPPPPKQRSSEITGTLPPAELPASSIGELLGELGVGEPKSFPGVPDEFGLMLALSECERSPIWRSLSSSRRAELTAILRAHKVRLRQPATARQISIRIQALMAQYWTPQLSDEVAAVMMGDWARAFADTPLWALEVACGRWINDPETARRKPLPADIKERLPSV